MSIETDVKVMKLEQQMAEVKQQMFQAYGAISALVERVQSLEATDADAHNSAVEGSDVKVTPNGKDKGRKANR